MKRKGRLLFVLGVLCLLQAGGVAWSQVSERVSVDSTGTEGNNASTVPSTSNDGRHVAFESQADNLVAGDILGNIDIFVHDRQTGTTARVSVGLGGAEGDNDSTDPSISGDGRFVAFESFATNLLGAGNDNNGFSDVFVHDLQTGTTTRVSVDSGGVEGSGASFNPSISSDGRYVAFESDVDFVLNDFALWDIYVHDRQTGATTLASKDSFGAAGNDSSYAPSISGDGRYVAFESFATNLLGAGNDNNGFSDVFVHDLQTGVTTRVSVDSGGAEGDGDSSSCSISGDGRYTVFASDATNLLGAGNDNNGSTDVFVHDRQTGATTRVSVDSAGAEGDNSSNFPSISSDGRYVAFASDATNLVGAGNDNNGSTDIFVRDRDTDGDGIYDEPGSVSTTRVSKDSVGVEGNGNSTNPSISADGSSVTFESDATNLLGVGNDNNGAPDIFADDLQGGAGVNEGDGDGNSSGGCFIATAAN